MMAATYNKFDVFLTDLLKGIHNCVDPTGVFKIYLAASSAAPAVGHTQKSQIAEFMTTQFGYTSGGQTINNGVTQSTGQVIVTASDKTWTATGGTWNEFLHIVLYNDTASNDPLIAWWSYSSPLTMQSGDTFTADFGSEVFRLA